MNEEAPIIEVFKPLHREFNAEFLLHLPSDTAYGNMTLAFLEIISRFDCINELIISLFGQFYEMRKPVANFHERSVVDYYRQKFYTEQIFYWLRKSSDELIAMMHIFHYFKQHGKYPTKLKISSIAHLIYDEGSLGGSFNKHLQVLNSLNEVSNGYKHSINNSQANAYQGRDYPVAFAYTLAHNDLKKEAKFHAIDIRVFLKEYSLFLEDAKSYLAEFETRNP